MAPSEIGAFLKALRERAGISRTKISKLLGMQFTNIVRWERGEQIPRTDAFFRYLAACGIKPKYVRDRKPRRAIHTAAPSTPSVVPQP